MTKPETGGAPTFRGGPRPTAERRLDQDVLCKRCRVSLGAIREGGQVLWCGNAKFYHSVRVFCPRGHPNIWEPPPPDDGDDAEKIFSRRARPRKGLVPFDVSAGPDPVGSLNLDALGD